MTSSRFYEGYNNNGGAWRERIYLEDRTAKMVQLQNAATKAGRQFFDPEKQNYSRFGARATVQAGATSHALPHLISDDDRKRILQQLGITSTSADWCIPDTMNESNGNLPKVADSVQNSRTSSRASVSSLGSRRSRATSHSKLSRSTLDDRLEKLESSLMEEKQGRMAVQAQLEELRRLMESGATSPTIRKSSNIPLPLHPNSRRAATPTLPRNVAVVQPQPFS